MSNLQNKLKELSGGQESNWKEKAQWRLKNRKWLRLSSNIARRMGAAMEENKGMNQKTLAEQIGVSSQYISKVLRGEENLTLETIAKLSEALGIELIAFPEYKYSQPVAAGNFRYANTAIVISMEDHISKYDKNHLHFPVVGFNHEYVQTKHDLKGNDGFCEENIYSQTNIKNQFEKCI